MLRAQSAQIFAALLIVSASALSACSSQSDRIIGSAGNVTIHKADGTTVDLRTSAGTDSLQPVPTRVRRAEEFVQSRAEWGCPGQDFTEGLEPLERDEAEELRDALATCGARWEIDRVEFSAGGALLESDTRLTAYSERGTLTPDFMAEKGAAIPFLVGGHCASSDTRATDGSTVDPQAYAGAFTIDFPERLRATSDGELFAEEQLRLEAGPTDGTPLRLDQARERSHVRIRRTHLESAAPLALEGKTEEGCRYRWALPNPHRLELRSVCLAAEGRTASSVSSLVIYKLSR